MLNTNVLAAYAGYCNDVDKLRQSASGGAATVLSEAFIKNGGVVYGAAYSEDFSHVHYKRVSRIDELQCLKGSKYIRSEKVLFRGNEQITVFEAIKEDLSSGQSVLFIGVGCDVAAVKCYCKSEGILEDNLYTVELICAGVTDKKVHNDYVKWLEEKHRSKLVSLSVRNKRDGWIPAYIEGVFDNGERHIVPFLDSPYGKAFLNYKDNSCYVCKFKGDRHPADIALGDYWGVKSDSAEYNKNGVSLILIQNAKGQELFGGVDWKTFDIFNVDIEKALIGNPAYYKSVIERPESMEFKHLLKEKGLFEAVTLLENVYSSPRLDNDENKETAIWGCGGCFHRLAPFILENVAVKNVVDRDPNKIGRRTELGIMCESPEVLKGKDVFVIITIDNAAVLSEVTNELIDMGITSFDHVDNWIKRRYRM